MESIEAQIEALRRQLAKCDTESVLGMIAYLLVFSKGDLHLETGLSSPLKQLFYLAGLLLTTDDQSQTTAFSRADFQRIAVQLNGIERAYIDTYFDFPANSQSRSPEWVSFAMFVNYYLTAPLTTPEQVLDRIERWFRPFDKEIAQHLGMSATRLIKIYTFVEGEMQRTLDELVQARGQPRMPETAQRLFKISRVSLADRFQGDARTFLELFSMERSNGALLYYAGGNPFEQSPLWRMPDDQVFCVYPKALLNAIYGLLYRTMESSSHKENWYRLRDKTMENQSSEILENMLGENAQFFRSVFEGDDSQKEHDLLVVLGRNLFIVEAKASKMKEPMRDAEKAYVRIRRDFRSDRGIQKAYDQGLALKQLIQKQRYTLLYDARGHVVCTIDSREVDKIFIICLTAENWGMVATNLSFLLKKPDDEPHPWASNVYGLETIADAFAYKNLRPEDFVRYLELREEWHDRLLAADELEICGLYLRYRNFDALDKEREGYYIPHWRMSDIFDEIYYNKLGHEYPATGEVLPSPVAVDPSYIRWPDVPAARRELHPVRESQQNRRANRRTRKQK